MKLYPKKLDSLEALKREKIRLRYERRQTKSSDLNPLSELGRSKISGTAKSGLLSTVMDLASSQSQWQTAMAIGKPLLKMLRKHRSKKREIMQAAGLPPQKSFASKLISDIAVNYIIGKALQMSIHGVQLYMKRRKAKKTVQLRYY